MRKDLENATGEAVVFPLFALEMLAKAGTAKAVNQVYVWIQIIKINPIEINLSLQDLCSVLNLSRNTIKDILQSLHNHQIIDYYSTKETRSNKIRIVHLPVKVWFKRGKL